MLIFLALGCAAFEPMAVMEQKYGKAGPVISTSFASKQLWPGETWKVYLNASDPDGDMKSIICTITQPGMGTYPPSFVRIREENRKVISGYLYWITGGSNDIRFYPIELTVQIQDMAGHLSTPVSFPLSFRHGIRQEKPPKDTFQEKELGPIMISLRGPSA